MIIDKVEINAYEIKFKDFYVNSKFSINSRKGWILKLSSGDNVGYGDASPLDQFSSETYSQAGYGLEGFRLSLENIGNINLEEILELAKVHGESQPSVQCCIESAIFDLMSKKNNLPLNKYLNDNASSNIRCSLYDTSNSKPFDGMILKIKIKDKNVFNELERIDLILEKFNGIAKLRLDFNGSYDLTRAIRFCKMLEGRNIDYLEQPLPPDNLDDMHELSLHTDIPIAADEMLTDIDSAYKILDKQAATIFILKPMIIGGYNDIKKIITMAKAESIRYNISSLLESNIGRLYYMHLCSALDIKDANGIATNVFFESDLCAFPDVIDGTIAIDNKSGIGINAINL